MRFVIPSLTDPNAHPRAVRRAVGHRAAEVRQALRDHKERIRPLLPPALQQLQETALHDALVRSLRIDARKRTMQLCLLCDDKDGFFDLRLDYKDIDLSPQEASLLCLLAYVDAEVYRDEIDLAATGLFIHRISWRAPVQTDYEVTEVNADGEELGRRYSLSPEIELRFGGLEIEAVRRADRHLSRAADFIRDVRDPNIIEGMDALPEPPK